MFFIRQPASAVFNQIKSYVNIIFHSNLFIADTWSTLYNVESFSGDLVFDTVHSLKNDLLFQGRLSTYLLVAFKVPIPPLKVGCFGHGVIVLRLLPQISVSSISQLFVNSSFIDFN